MNIARVSANGQITVPVEIRRLLKLKEGDKVLFLQKAFAGVAAELGNPTEEEIQSWVDEARYGKAENA